MYKNESEVAGEDHFMTENGKIKWLLTREKDDAPVTVMKIHLEKGGNPARSPASGLAGSDLRPCGQGHHVHRWRR